MAQQNANVLSGNHIYVVLDGKRVGLIRSVRASDSYNHEAAYGIGDINPVEHVPTAARYSLSVSALNLKRGNMRDLQITRENGEDVLKGLVMDFEFYDKRTGTFLYKYVGCSYDSGDVDVSANAIVVSNAQFLALNRVGTAI